LVLGLIGLSQKEVQQKKKKFLGGGARFQISFSMAEIVPNGVNHKISTTKNDCRAGNRFLKPPKIPKKRKKSVGTSM
jgi:hypothetical protein